LLRIYYGLLTLIENGTGIAVYIFEVSFLHSEPAPGGVIVKRTVTLVAIAGLFVAFPAYSVVIDLDTVTQAACGQNIPTNDPSGPQPPAGDFGTVTGPLPTATPVSPCWFNGVDPNLGNNDNNDGYQFGGTLFERVSKTEDGSNPVTGDPDIGLSFSGGADSGAWSVDSSYLATIGDFILGFKQDTLYGLWLFQGSNNLFDNGFYSLWQGGNPPTGELSHLTLFAADGVTVPTPAPLALLGLGLVLMGVARRRR
jgi:hypothetical protein